MRSAWDYYAIFSDKIFDLSEGLTVEWEGRLGQIGPGQDTDIMVGITPSMSAYWEDNGIWTWYDNKSSGSIYDQKAIISGSSGPNKACNPPETTDWVRMTSAFNQTATTYWDEKLGACTLIRTVPWTDVYLGIAGDTDSSDLYGFIDWIAVRKYAPSEPVATVLSEEP